MASSRSRRRARDRRAPAAKSSSLVNVDKPRAEYSYKEVYPDFNPSKRIREFVVSRKNGNENQDQQSADKVSRSAIIKPGVRVVDEFGKDIFVNSAMASVGYQETDEFDMPQEYIRSLDHNMYHVYNDEDIRPNSLDRTALGYNAIPVEYDMDAQDTEFLKWLNQQRVEVQSVPEISPEIFEITMTLFEVEWYKIEQRMPPKRKTVVADELSDSNDEQVCCICNESECDNSNAIVFCDGCDIAVHQDCYGVPFIPEGQWLCRQCMISRKRRASCIFCPNKSGALKLTDSQHWAHVLCALWIPEVTIANEVYMEPICDVDKIPKGRWKLVCYICKQKVGACIQCSSKSCFQAFHPTCARKARLCLQMTSGIRGAVHDPASMFSFCDRHTPEDYEEDYDTVREYTRKAQKHYSDLARMGRGAQNGYSSERNIVRETKIIRIHRPGAAVWRTDQGTPAIPNITIAKIGSILNRFGIIKCRSYLVDVAKYWTLKRQHRRGAALTKRFQLALEAVPSENITRSAAEKKVEAYDLAISDLEKLKKLLEEIRQREALKSEIAQNTIRTIDLTNFPVFVIIEPLWNKIKDMCDRLGLLEYTAVPGDKGVEFKLDGPSLIDKVEAKQHLSIQNFINDVEEYFECFTKGLPADTSIYKVSASILRLVRNSSSDLEKRFSTIKLNAEGRPEYPGIKIQRGLADSQAGSTVVRRNLRKR